MIRRFARPYAQALFKAAGSTDGAIAVRDDLRRLHTALQAVPALGQMAANPAVPLDKKESILRAVASQIELGEVALRLALLLLKNFRLGALPAILEAFEAAINRRLGVAMAEIATAEPLDAASQTRLQAALAQRLGQSIELKTTVEPSLLGGFVARVGSTLYDASLKGQVDRLAQQLAAQA